MPALIVSLGGSPEPVVYTLRENRPTHVAYLCSPASRELAEQISHQIDFSPVVDFLEVENYEELGPCYKVLRDWIPLWLERHDIDTSDVIVDYTGGTKTMSAALVLAGTEVFSQFSYVGGVQRDKSGVGIVISGAERSHYQSNPWRELAVRESKQAEQLWSLQQYDAAATVLRKAKGQVPMEKRKAYGRVITLALALSDRLALQLPRAAQKLEKIAKALERDDTPSQDPLFIFCRKAIERFHSADATRGPAADPSAQLRELIDNAILTSRLGRFDDAAARLYRALELFGQNELRRLTDGAFHLGRLDSAASLPPRLIGFPAFQGEDGLQAARDGISLEQVYRVLAHLDHPLGLKATADFDGDKHLKSPWRQATQRRNQSILGHGIQPVDTKGFDDLASIIAIYTGMDTTHVDLESPRFDTGWID